MNFLVRGLCITSPLSLVKLGRERRIGSLEEAGFGEGDVSSMSLPLLGLPLQHKWGWSIMSSHVNCLVEVQRGLKFGPENMENFPPTNLKMAALCHSTSSCFFLAGKKKPPFIWQTSKGLERSWEHETREKLKGLKRKEFSYPEPLTVLGDSYLYPL